VRKAEGRNPKTEEEIRKRAPNREGSSRAVPGIHNKRHGLPPPISAITFDVGGTLIECRPSVGHIYAEVAAQHGYSVSPELLNRRFRLTWRSAEGFRHTRADWSALVDATFAGLIRELPSRTFFPQLYDRFSEPEAWHVYEDVLPALRALKSRGLRLGIISNWDERLRPLLERLQLSAYFDTVVVSCELGFCKPSPELFRAACSALGSPVERTLHVGDDWDRDVLGARASGLQALHVRRGRGRELIEELSSLSQLDKL